MFFKVILFGLLAACFVYAAEMNLREKEQAAVQENLRIAMGGE